MRGDRTARAALAAVILALTVGASGQAPSPSARENAYAANNRGVALLEQFNFARAAAAFRDALRIDPALAIARVNLGIALFYVPDLEGAKREETEAARLVPASPQPAYVLGLIAREENRDDEATALFERVRGIDPRDTGSIVNLAQIAIQNRQYDEAIALLRPAIADEPFNVTATYNLGLALTRAGQEDDGRRLMERSQTLRGSGYGVTLTNSYLEQGRYAEAIASTGAESDLVDTAPPRAAFAAPTTVAGRPVFDGPSAFGMAVSNLSDDGVRTLVLELHGGVTLADVDGDGDLDVLHAGPGVQLYRNDGGGRFADITSNSGFATADNALAVCVVAGDYDNDGKPDVLVIGYGRNRLFHNEGSNRFVDVTDRVGLPDYPFLPGAAAFVDVDHDGDLDIVVAGLADVNATRARPGPHVFPGDFVPAPLQLLRNNGNGTFTDITRESGLRAIGHAIAIVPTDFDNRRDVDLLIVYRDSPPVLYKNLRDGTFRDVASEVGLGGIFVPGSEIASVAAADVNKDDYPDFFFGRANVAGVFAMSDGRGRFTTTAGPADPRGVTASQFVDFDNDGLLDLLTWSDEGARLWRNVGTRWVDTTEALPFAAAKRVPSARGVAIADVDGNGAADVVVDARPGALSLFRNGGDARNHVVRVQLKGRVSNRTAAGAKVQLRAGSLGQRLETSSATPAVTRADVAFGIGPRAGADVARVLWPSGILQAETLATPAPATITVEELDRKPSSCPFLYTWNGERFEFITDFMGGGEMGYWEGPGERNHPNPIEYVRIRGDQLVPRGGRYEIRVTNELEETLYVDRLQLLAIRHPAGIDVFPNEGMTDPPRPFRLHAVTDARPPVRATDDHGHDVTERIARLDRRYPDDFALKTVRGYAADHVLTLELARNPSAPVLLLTGWTDYAFSSDNVAGRQAGWTLTPPRLDAKDARGRWRTIVPDVGIPVGRPQTIALDLGGLLEPGEREVRIVTNMRIYWDQILVATAARPDRLLVDRLDPRSAVVRERGFSRVIKPDGREPETYDYARVLPTSPWKVMTGRYTRPGDVLPLLVRADDMFVVSKPGDEIALAFDAPSAPLPPGWTRTFLLMADGFSKEMDINSASPDRVEPLPFHRMTRYPYAAPERYPDSIDYERYRAEYNTRVVPGK